MRLWHWADALVRYATSVGAVLVVGVVVAALRALPGVDATVSQPAPTFAASIAGLSEPGGYFDTDNLISNERSYLQVVPDLRRLSVRGGAYIGVGPDQNFSYIAESGRRSRSSSTCAATTCCSICSSRRCSSCPGPDWSTSPT